jgi:hypothetical protein
MSIIIKGMEMPKHCWQCVLKGEIDECLLIDQSCMAVWGEEKRLPNCPLVELPPHGRLIDADALIARIRRAKELQPELSDLYENEATEMLLWVGTEPTVIEAEEVSE